MNKYILASLIANYEMDEPHFDEEDPHYADLDDKTIMYWLGLEHDGDCVKQPQPCRRYAAEDWVHKAGWLLEELKRKGYEIREIEDDNEYQQYYITL